MFNFCKLLSVYKSEKYELITSDNQIDIRFFTNRGFRPLNPDLLFVLKQKVSKKFKTAPASHEKLALDRLNRPNSLKFAQNLLTYEIYLCELQLQTRTIFNAVLTDFSAHRTRSIGSEMEYENIKNSMRKLRKFFISPLSMLRPQLSALVPPK